MSDRTHSYTINKIPSRFAFLVLASVLVVVAAGCTRSSIPAGEVRVQPTTAFDQDEPVPTYIPFTAVGTYAVTMVSKDEELVVRNPAGAAGSEVAVYEFDATGILLTGNSTALGSSTWIELDLGRGQTGWVNARNLTEDVSREVFCADIRSIELLEMVLQAFSNKDGALLAQVTNPRRGLLVRNEWWNTAVEFNPDVVTGLFEDRNEYR